MLSGLLIHINKVGIYPKRVGLVQQLRHPMDINTENMVEN